MYKRVHSILRETNLRLVELEDQVLRRWVAKMRPEKLAGAKSRSTLLVTVVNPAGFLLSFQSSLFLSIRTLLYITMCLRKNPLLWGNSLGTCLWLNPSPGNGRSKARKRGHQGLEFLKWALISQTAWHNEVGVRVVLVIVLGCFLCCGNQWSEAGEGLGNLQELMLEREKEQKIHDYLPFFLSNHYKMLSASTFAQDAT